MKSIKSFLVILVWIVLFVMTSVFLLVEYWVSFFKAKTTGIKSERYFKPRPIFPHEKET